MAESLSIVVYCGAMVLPFSSRSSSVEGVVVVSASASSLSTGATTWLI